MRHACWDADGVRGRKLELEHFSDRTASKFISEDILSLTLGKPFGLSITTATAVTDRQLEVTQPAWFTMV